MGKLILLYEETSQENPDSSRRDNVLSNLSDKKEITYFCLIVNEEVKDRDASDNDDDDACTSDEEKDEEMEYDIPDVVYDSLHNYSKCKSIKSYFIILDFKKDAFLKLKIWRKRILNCLKKTLNFKNEMI